MTKRWIYALMVAAIIVVGAIAGPVLAVSQGTIGAPEEASSIVNQASGAGVSQGVSIYPGPNTPPNFEWYIVTYATNPSHTVVYKVPAGSRFQLDDVSMSYSGQTGFSQATMYRGIPGNPIYLLYVNLGVHDHYEHSFKNIVLNGGEQLEIKSWDNSNIAWTISGHLV
jgi:hypothetical protein